MLDRPIATLDYSLEQLTLTAPEGMLCLAPHPDDEVLGCAGLLMLAQGQGLRVHSIIITAGQEGWAPQNNELNPRLEESRAAARLMGLPQPECWHLDDRQIRYAPPLIERIVAALHEHKPRWLLLPALTEPHPDHQALALAGMAAVQRLGVAIDLIFYEVGAPMQPNTVVDISAVADRKWQALDVFASQEQLHPYRSHAQAMAVLRAFGRGPGVVAAEAFWRLPADAVGEYGALSQLAYWPLRRQALGLAVEPSQLPLVSVIVRSMNRPSLAQAIASVAEQTYPHIEVVVVNATGAPHPEPPYPAQRMVMRVVEPFPQEPGAHPVSLGRSAAANLGLQSSQGRYALFLDDDDLLGPTHLEILVDALQANRRAIAAYTGVRVEGAGGEWLRDYDIAWDPHRLWGINYLPIHSTMFRLDSARAARFDETLPVLEDWDYWCQLSRLGEFVHIPGIHAVYRQGLGDSRLSEPAHDNHWVKWHLRILEQHAQRWGIRDQSAALAWHAVALDRVEREQRAVVSEVQRLHETLAQERIAGQQQTQDLLNQLQAERDERDLVQRSLQLLQQSRPVRWARWLRRAVGMGRDDRQC